MAEKRLSWTFFFVGLGVVSAAAGVVYYEYGQRSLTLAVSRTISSPIPPWTYDPDWTRFLGFVVEPLCQPDASSPFHGIRGVSAGPCTSVPTERVVEVQLRPRLGWSPSEVQGALDAYRDRAKGVVTPLFDAVDVDEERGILQVHAAGSSSTEALLRDLMTTPVSFPKSLRGEDDRPVGTGPFVVEDIGSATTDDVPPEPIAGMIWGTRAGEYGDEVVLRRKSLFPLGSLREVIFVGVNEPHDSTLAAALNAGSLQAAWGFAKAIESSRPEPGGTIWRQWSERTVFTRIAVLNPSGNEGKPPEGTVTDKVPALSEGCKRYLRDGLAYLSDDPAFLAKTGDLPARQPLPSSSPPFRFSPIPLALTPPEGERCTYWILTNKNWKAVAEAVETALEDKDRKIHIEVRALEPENQMAWETARAFHATILSYPDMGDPPASFLFSNFSQFLPARDLSALLEKETARTLLPDGIATFLAQAESSLVPLGTHGEWYAVSYRLLGMPASGSVLYSTLLDIARPAATWMIAGGISLLTLSVGVSAVLTLLARRARAEAATLERLMAFYHHELSSPLTSARSRVDEVFDEGDPRRKGVLADLDAALDVVDRTYWFFQKGVLHESLRRSATDLAPVVARVRATLLDRATGLGLASPSVDVDLPYPPPLVRLSEEAALHLFTNLLENALKYRSGAKLIIRIRGSLRREVLRVTVEDKGVGINPSISSRKLFHAGFRTEEARARHVAGSGIGLTVCYEILRAVGGRIRLTRSSSPTTFELDIPIAHPTKPRSDA